MDSTLAITYEDAIFFLYTHMTFRFCIGYIILTPKVTKGYSRSNTGHTITKTLSHMIFYQYNQKTHRFSLSHMNFASKVMKGH